MSDDGTDALSLPRGIILKEDKSSTYTGQDMRHCFLRLMEPATPGGAPRARLAKSCVREMLSILLKYGAGLGPPGCLELHQVLGRMTLTLQGNYFHRRAWHFGAKKERPPGLAKGRNLRRAIGTRRVWSTEWCSRWTTEEI